MSIEKRKYVFKKGDRPPLDEVYDIISIIPIDATYQDDINDKRIPENDAGESVLFLKDVIVEIKLTIK